MTRKPAKPSEKSVRLDTPPGVLGVPRYFFYDDTVIIITDGLYARRLLNSAIWTHDALPQ